MVYCGVLPLCCYLKCGSMDYNFGVESYRLQSAYHADFIPLQGLTKFDPGAENLNWHKGDNQKVSLFYVLMHRTDEVCNCKS
jgi:hypothetical protein